MALLASAPRLHRARILDRREPFAGIVVLGFEAPELARTALPGQFVLVVPPHGQLAATALGIYEAHGMRASLLIVAHGPRTAELAACAPGATLDLLGPLGNGFFLDAIPPRVAIVAGGVGLASVLLAAEACVRAGAATTLYYGARTAEALVDRELFARAGARVVVATDDGSDGHHGYVTDLLRAEEPADLILACGPSPMLRAVAAVAHQRGIRAQLSLEETFACGVGACWGCVVSIDRSSAQAPSFPSPAADESRTFVHARICREGPVFWAHELRW